MDTPNHHGHPELWFRPSPTMPFAVLSKCIGEEEMTTTLRLGKRDGSHPKGYIPGTIATVRVFDDERREQLSKKVQIQRVVSKRLADLEHSELTSICNGSGVSQVQQDLSFFEGRPVASDETVSLVEFTYLN